MLISVIPHDKANHTPMQANQTASSTDLICKLPKAGYTSSSSFSWLRVCCPVRVTFSWCYVGGREGASQARVAAETSRRTHLQGRMEEPGCADPGASCRALTLIPGKMNLWACTCVRREAKARWGICSRDYTQDELHPFLSPWHCESRKSSHSLLP